MKTKYFYGDWILESKYLKRYIFLLKYVLVISPFEIFFKLIKLLCSFWNDSDEYAPVYICIFIA